MHGEVYIYFTGNVRQPVARSQQLLKRKANPHVIYNGFAVVGIGGGFSVGDFGGVGFEETNFVEYETFAFIAGRIIDLHTDIKAENEECKIETQSEACTERYLFVELVYSEL